MTNLEHVMSELEKLSLSLPPDFSGEVFRRKAEEGEPSFSVTLVSDHGGASAAFWARKHVGGIFETEVLDGSGKQLLRRYGEGLTVSEVEDAWNEMLARFLALGNEE